MKTLFRLTCLLLAAVTAQKAHADCCCPNTVIISSVPFEIDGVTNPSNTTYCLSKNLTYLGGVPTAAITVDPGVHDIVINFNGFELDIDPSVNGIDMLGTTSQPITDVIIKDGVIRSLAPSGTNSGINATNFNTVTVERMRFVDELRGFAAPVQTDTNTNLTMRSCVFDLKGITGSSRQSVRLSTIQGCLIEDCSFLPNDPNEIAAGGLGINLRNNFKDVLIKRCTFEGQTSRAINGQSIFDAADGFIFVFPSSNVQIDECEFVNNGGITFDVVSDIIMLGVSNVHVTNSSFFNTGNAFGSLVFSTANDGANNRITPIPNGLLVDNCTFTSSSSGTPLFQQYATLFAGSFPPGIGARDIIVQNSTFTHQDAPARADDLLFIGVVGALVENCVFDSTSSGRLENCVPTSNHDVKEKSANIHLGGPLFTPDLTEIIDGIGVSDTTIRGNVICGGAQVGIFAETSLGTVPNKRITIEDNSITATEVGILFENTHSSTIIGNRVEGVNGNSCTNGVGIKLDGPLSFSPTAQSSSNAILNNVISNNGIGLLLRCGAQGNLIKVNDIFNNNKQIVTKGRKTRKKNVFESNTIFLKKNKKLSCSS